MVVVLDIKDINATRACWDVVRRMKNGFGAPAYDWVIFKLNAPIYKDPKFMERDLADIGNFKYIPVYTTNMYDILNCINQYNYVKTQRYCMGAEVNLKQPNGIHQDIVNQVNSDRRMLTSFHPVPDGPGNGAGGKFYNADGTCCYTLAEKYYATKDGKFRDTEDRRPDARWLMQFGCKMIDTDAPEDVLKLLGLNSKRNTLWYLYNRPMRTALAATPALEVEKASFEVYPNPTEGQLTLKLQAASAGEGQFSLVDLQGKNVLTERKPLHEGSNEVKLTNLKNRGVKPGVYMLQTTLPSQQRKTVKVTVQ
jgi:hypothetical protein